MRNDIDLEPYEGLIFSTAARYAPYIEEEMDDLRQMFRVATWKALTSFDARLVTSKPTTREQRKTARDRYVFSCICNRVKDALKQQDRLNDRRGGTALFLGDIASRGFEPAFMAAEDAEVLELIEGSVELPSTLDAEERSLVAILLTGDFTRDEIAERMRVTRKRVLKVERSVQGKLADWAPDGFTVAAQAREPQLIA